MARAARCHRGGTTLSGRRPDGSKAQVGLSYAAKSVCGEALTSEKTGGGAYADPMKARGRIVSGHQVNLEDQVLASGPHPTATPEPAQDPRVVRGGGELANRSSKIDQMKALWATPAARDYRYPNAKSFRERVGGSKGEQLCNQVAHLMKAMWSTPRSSDGAHGGPNMSFTAGGVSSTCASSEGNVGNTDESGQDEQREQRSREQRGAGGDPISYWADAEWIVGADGKARRVKSGVRLLAHGIPARVAKLRALGNAIVPQVAAEFIGAYLDAVSI